MKVSAKWVLVGIGLSMVGIVGINRLSFAVQPASAVIPTQESAKQSENSENDGGKEQEAAKQLQSLAKITPQQAQQAAISANPGQVSRVKLENEDGNLIYGVVIGQKEVAIDAGNGKVLYIDSLNPEKDASIRPRSSIQVTEPVGGDGDGDGETQDDTPKHP